MELPAIIGAIAASSVLGGGLASLYFRAQSSDMTSRMAVLEFRAEDTAKQVEENYKYCHLAAHKTLETVTSCDARMQLNVMDLAQRIAVAEFQLKAKA